MKKKTVIKRICIALSILLFITFSASVLASAYWLKTSAYNIHIEGIHENLNFVCLSDLHDREFGKENCQLIEKVKSAAPQFIALIGDMLPSEPSHGAITKLCSLIRQLRQIAPVYFSLGNVERKYQREYGDVFLTHIANAGATVLEENWVTVEINGTSVRLGGMYAYAFPLSEQSAWETDSTYIFLRDFTDTDLPTILLCHRPESFILNDSQYRWNIDLLLCGHTHGGIIRFPFLGGLTATDQGWFPEYDYGAFQLGGTTMLISSGFAGYRWIPRFNNRPEIVSVTLTTKKSN